MLPNGWFLLGKGLCTALMRASLNGHLEVVKLLLSQPGVDVNVKEKVKYLFQLTNHMQCQAYSPLYYYCQNGLTARTCGKTDQIKDLIRQHRTCHNEMKHIHKFSNYLFNLCAYLPLAAYRGLPPPTRRGAASHSPTAEKDTAKEIASPASTYPLTAKTGGNLVNLELVCVNRILVS